MDLVSTCEGCEGQPQQVANIELTPNPQGVTRTTVCLFCLALLQELPPGDPVIVALINRIEDFKQAWPDKADINTIFHASDLLKTDKDRALQILVNWHKSKLR